MQTKRISLAFGLLLILVSLLSACAPQAAPTEIPAATPAPLTGALTRAEVQAAAGWETLTAADYTPDPALVEAIKADAGEVEVLLFLGTWCGDSKREVPHFFKLMDAAGIAESQVTIIGLDRTKKDAAGLTEQWGIEYVPTFVFLRDGVEIGRIVERPAASLEASLAEFLAAGS